MFTDWWRFTASLHIATGSCLMFTLGRTLTRLYAHLQLCLVMFYIGKKSCKQQRTPGLCANPGT